MLTPRPPRSTREDQSFPSAPSAASFGPASTAQGVSVVHCGIVTVVENNAPTLMLKADGQPSGHQWNPSHLGRRPTRFLLCKGLTVSFALRTRANSTHREVLRRWNRANENVEVDSRSYCRYLHCGGDRYGGFGDHRRGCRRRLSGSEWVGAVAGVRGGSGGSGGGSSRTGAAPRLIPCPIRLLRRTPSRQISLGTPMWLWARTAIRCVSTTVAPPGMHSRRQACLRLRPNEPAWAHVCSHDLPARKPGWRGGRGPKGRVPRPRRRWRESSGGWRCCPSSASASASAASHSG